MNWPMWRLALSMSMMDTWRAAFDAIFAEYNRIGDEMFGKPAEEEQESGE